MLRTLVFLFICFTTNIAYSQIDISEARDMAEGAIVTVEGIATNGAELGIIRYLQDDTGGIAVYPGTGSTGSFPDDVQRGDLVQVTGPLKIYNGLLEIDPVSAYTIISSENALPEPLETSPNGINEDTEAELLKVTNVTFTDGGSIFGVGNYEINGAGESSEIYVRSGHALIGTEIPIASVNITGISSQFNSTYQILPRDLDDIEIADNFYFTTSPIQSNLATSGFTVTWETNVAGNSTIEYGTTPALGMMMENAETTTSHSFDLVDLEPSTFYYVTVSSNDGSSTITSTQKVFTTASNSSGAMKIYFNQGVDGTFSTGGYPNGTTGAAIEAEIISRIDAANVSIDAAFYNINRETIVAALTAAHNRGVVVRYVADNETANLALENPAPPFPIVRGNAEGLMHNKFLSIDADDVDNAWIMTGSTNMTAGNIAEDPNNLMFIQDKSLALAYRLEFEEMWGTDGPTPGIFNLLFGAAKTNNTPHQFLVNDILIESYFSPTDNTTTAIVNAIETANDDVQFAVLSFTNNELGSAVLAAHNAGIDLRGIMNNLNDQGSEYEFLLNNGVNITGDNNSSLDLHHKYCIIDATNPNSDPQVVLGSHNWSGGAETRNDENTLIIHDAGVANIYLQEFEARWCEVQGNASCVTSVDETKVLEGVNLDIYPNPARSVANINIDLEEEQDVILNLLNINGVFLQSIVLNNLRGNHSEILNVAALPAGQYIVQVKVGNEQISRFLQVIK